MYATKRFILIINIKKNIRTLYFSLKSTLNIVRNPMPRVLSISLFNTSISNGCVCRLVVVISCLLCALYASILFTVLLYIQLFNCKLEIYYFRQIRSFMLISCLLLLFASLLLFLPNNSFNTTKVFSLPLSNTQTHMHTVSIYIYNCSLLDDNSLTLDNRFLLHASQFSHLPVS